MSATRILIVDDEQRMRKLLRDYMIREGYSVLEASGGKQALDLFFSEENIALIILDVMMPEMDGWQVCARIRETSKVPIIMLTARSDERDELRGFDLGVDEYVTKPFSPRTLAARVNAILRRTMGSAAEKHLSAGGIEMDKAAHIVTIDGQAVDLSFKEFELLQLLTLNPGKQLTTEYVLERVWPDEPDADGDTVFLYVSYLRRKLSGVAASVQITGERGGWYCLETK